MGRDNGVVLALLLVLAVANLANHKRVVAKQAFKSFTAHFSREEYAKAEEYANAALSGDPENAYYVGAKALVRACMVPAINCPNKCDGGAVIINDQDRQNILEAIQLYQRAIALNPSDGSFHHNLGRLYGFMDEQSLAVQSLEKAIAVNPDIPLYHVSLGLYLEFVGRNQDAFKEYLTAIELSPSLIDSQAFSDFQGRHGIEAQEIVAQVIKRLEAKLAGDDPIQRSKLSRLYLHVDRKEEAYQSLLIATQELPTLSRPWIYLGDHYKDTEEWTLMLLCYQRAGFLNADDFLPWARLGNYYYDSGQDARAINAYERALFAWWNKRSMSAERADRIYRTLDVVRDDMIPKGFLTYCAPRFDAPTITKRLAGLYRTNGDKEGATSFDDVRSRIPR